jgi:hypothetical protein
MSVPEAEQSADKTAEQLLYERVFNFRPPLPVGTVDISWVEEEAQGHTAEHPGYAWERLPRWVAEIRDTYKKSEEMPVFHIDLGSSIPLYAQHMRALEFKRCDERAGEFIRRLKNDNPGHELGIPELTLLHKELFTGGKSSSLTQDLLRSVLQAVLYTRTLSDFAGDNTDELELTFSRRLQTGMREQTSLYLMDRTHTDIESNWSIKFHEVTQPQLYGELISAIGIATPESIEAGKRIGSGMSIDVDADRELAREKVAAGEHLAEIYLQWQAKKLATMIAEDPRLRPARFISTDMADPLEIAVSSVLTTPQSTRHLNLFSHAVRSLFDENLHLRHDLVQPLPVPDNSVSLITCFDAWPFYSTFEGLSDDELDIATDVAIEMIYGWYGKLAYGGKMVIFPWAAQERDERSQRILDTIRRWMSLLTGTPVGGSIFHEATLMSLMSESDQETAAQLSPIFGQGTEPEIEVFIIEKPNKLLVRQHRNRLPQRLATASRIRG